MAFFSGLRALLLITVILSSLVATTAHASKVDFVTVTTFGVGATKKEAIQDAVISGLEQVNGQVMSAKERATLESVVTYEGGVESESSREALSQDVSTRTKGVVRGYTPLSIEPLEGGEFEATVEVTVAVLKQSQQLLRTKIAVVQDVEKRGELSVQIERDLVRLLTASRKFAVLDRENSSAIQQELQRIEEGVNIADMVRLGSGVAPDLLAVVRTEILAEGTEKVDLFATLEVIDYGTRQIKFSHKDRIRLKRRDSDSKRTRKVGMLSKKLYRALIEKVAQPTVVGFSEGAVTIGQGKEFFQVGDRVLLQLKGEEIVDSYTGERLGSNLQEIGSAEVIFVNPNISIARAVGRVFDIGARDVADRRVTVTKQAGNKTIKEMKKSTKGFLDDL